MGSVGVACHRKWAGSHKNDEESQRIKVLIALLHLLGLLLVQPVRDSGETSQLVFTTICVFYILTFVWFQKTFLVGLTRSLFLWMPAF